MKLHKEGYSVMLVTLLVIAILSIATWFFIPWKTLQILIYIGFFVELIWTISFFRVPDRTINLNENHVLSSADGKIVAIEEVTETEFFKDKRIMVSVFMSPFNIHVNWYPFNGKIIYTKYHPGKFLLAYNPKSSTDNERNSIVLEKEPGKSVLIRQIAGLMARRIVSMAKPDDKVNQGEEFGIIKFGSRVDLFLPTDVNVNVKIGEKVCAQKTVIAYFS
ncbi:MAG: phosphatidylserine decarboxylase family protein [Bacteroidetes bacterium]|jgi:phosphatidylserine decarboxylase|nr:phosphatidylserine decarboxylase family protein [Bacteroidota bacterium]|tara:strand:+ start:153 stop:809 length:657 start_codon:yes stop_codon:yes gene_type:complete